VMVVVAWRWCVVVVVDGADGVCWVLLLLLLVQVAS